MLGAFKEPWIFCQAIAYLMAISRNEGKNAVLKEKKKKNHSFVSLHFLFTF